MSEMKEMIVEVVEKIFKKHFTKESVDLVDDGNWAENVWDILEEKDLLRIASSEHAGGAGGDLDDLLTLYSLIGKYAAPIPFVETTLANYFLESAGLSISNKKVTYSVKAQQVTRNDDAINGILYEIPWARHVDELVIMVEGQLVHISLSEAFIEPHSNLAGEPRDKVTLKDAKVIQVSSPLSLQQSAQFIVLDTAAKNAIISGALTKANDLTVKYTKEREQFGRPIHRFQLVQQHLAILAGEVVITNAAVENMITALLSHDGFNEVGYTRIRIDEAAKTVAASAHQVHAAIGVTHEHSLHQYTRRLWAWRDEGYTVNYWKKEIAKKLLQTETTDIWTYLTNPQESIKPIKEAQNG
ncbi:acyl-CoA dehydrogenase family protein [Rummeliibacillus pycnus]|uniref:acyl-CoA dehydrogenase family protein n=1 Tax=Rummeliibacillus pycnus TaxID=101070 RepID=UPI003D2BF22E